MLAFLTRMCRSKAAYVSRWIYRFTWCHQIFSSVFVVLFLHLFISFSSLSFPPYLLLPLFYPFSPSFYFSGSFHPNSQICFLHIIREEHRTATPSISASLSSNAKSKRVFPTENPWDAIKSQGGVYQRKMSAVITLKRRRRKMLSRWNYVFDILVKEWGLLFCWC